MSQNSVVKYYEDLGSRLGHYLFLRDSQHFGFYPTNYLSNFGEQDAQRAHHDQIAKYLELKETDVVLDPGCGRGFVSCDLAKRYGSSITGIDITPYVVQRAIKRSQQLAVSDRVSYVNGDYSNLPFKENSFDKLYTVETLCHAIDLPAVLREFYRVLKPGARLVFMEYTQKPLVEFSPYQRQMYDIIVEGTASPSLVKFVDTNFQALLAQAGFINTTQKDITDNFEPSFRRLYKVARLIYPIVKVFGLQRKMVNSTIGVEFYKMAKQNLLGYCIYTAVKPSATIT